MVWFAIGVVLMAFLFTYFRWYRPWQIRWGATDVEVAQHMPGDDHVLTPSFNATRGVTVYTSPDLIWGWLIQIGCKRAGWYSYDWIDNLGIPSANTLVPELQNISIGQLIPISPNGKIGLLVKAFETNQWILWTDPDNLTSWYWGLYPIDSDHTRLITRVRIHYKWLSPTLIFNLLLDAGDIVMMRKCMLGIKYRAEHLGLQPSER